MLSQHELQLPMTLGPYCLANEIGPLRKLGAAKNRLANLVRPNCNEIAPDSMNVACDRLGVLQNRVRELYDAVAVASGDPKRPRMENKSSESSGYVRHLAVTSENIQRSSTETHIT